ncbi:MAG: hypothetical protein ACRCU0_04370 [Candidatus Rhabdochlamydia sp.]
MTFKTGFFSNMVGRSTLANSMLAARNGLSSFQGTKSSEFTANKTHHLAGGLFSKLFQSFSFRIPKNLMNQFYQSADFYKRFPQLRPTFSDSSLVYKVMKLFKPIV